MVLFGVIVGAIYYQVKRDDKGIQNRSVLSFFSFFSFQDFSMHGLSVIAVTRPNRLQVEHVSLISLYRR